MDEATPIPAKRQGRRRRRWFFVAVAVVTVVVAGTAHARFTTWVTLGGNAFTTDSLAPPTSLTLTAVNPVGLSWTASASAYATGTNVYRSTTSGGTRTLAQQTPASTTTYSEDPGLGAYYYETRAYYQNWLSDTSNQVVRDDPTFVFKSTTGYTTSGNCDTTGQLNRDMEQGFAPTGPQETWTRTGGDGRVSFCSDTFVAGEVLTAGTTSVTAWLNNTSGSSCAITAKLTHNGTTTLGSGTVTVARNTSLRAFTWSFATTGFTAAAGDRLGLYVTWQAVKSCASTDLHWNASTTPSSVTVPTITGA